MKHKDSFEERKELLKLEKENLQFKHECKMKEIEEERKNMEFFHTKELERMRIKSAEIRKQQERKELFELRR